jgi:integrase
MKRQRVRGTGSIFKRGRVWWCAYTRDGLEHRFSAQTDIKEVAKNKLEARLKELDLGFTRNDYRVADLMASVISHYERHGFTSVQDAKERWKKHLAPVFANLRATRVTTEAVEEYARDRVAAGAAKATVNRELALLRLGFNLARKARKLQFVPHFPMFRENNARQGFLEDAQYDKLAAATAKRGLWLRAMFETAVQFGWRSGELKTMRVRQADIASKTLRLEPGTTKNREGREAVMPSTLALLIQQCATGKNPDEYMFTRDGKQIKDFRGEWEEATKEAGVPDLVFHDLRRTAVRNMIRRGIPQHIAMRISGHKTTSVFHRYAIVSSADLQDAARKMEEPILKLTVDVQSRRPSDIDRPN